MDYPECLDIHFSAQEVRPQPRVGGTSNGKSCWNNNSNDNNNDNNMDHLHSGISWEKLAFESVGYGYVRVWREESISVHHSINVISKH